MAQKWTLTYSVATHPEGVERDGLDAAHAALVEKNGGRVSASDQLLMVSMVYPPDGGLSLAVFGIDGKTGGALSGRHAFKAWVMAAQLIANAPDLDDGRAAFARNVFEQFADMVRSMAAADVTPTPGSVDQAIDQHALPANAAPSIPMLKDDQLSVRWSAVEWNGAPAVMIEAAPTPAGVTVPPAEATIMRGILRTPDEVLNTVMRAMHAAEVAWPDKIASGLHRVPSMERDPKDPTKVH